MADWDPELYNRFRRYRAEPFEWILARLTLRPDDIVADLGCGTGENTVELARRSGGYARGIDASPAMITAAEKLRATLEPELARRLSFAEGDFATPGGDQTYSLIFSNAALQWALNHRAILTAWYRALKPRGRLVVQMPSNHDETAQVTLTALAQEERWRAVLGTLRTPSQVVQSPVEYRSMLAAIGFTAIDCYYHTFDHPMENPGAIVEFCRATTLRPFLARLSTDQHVEFLAAFRQRLEQAYGTRGPVTLPFRRIFLWARRAGGDESL